MQSRSRWTKCTQKGWRVEVSIQELGSLGEFLFVPGSHDYPDFSDCRSQAKHQGVAG